MMNGRKSKISHFEALAINLRNSALKGDLKALKALQSLRGWGAIHANAPEDGPIRFTLRLEDDAQLERQKEIRAELELRKQKEGEGSDD